MMQMSSMQLIEKLIGFDTISRNSNLALIEWVADYLDGYGIGCELFYDDDHQKANLFATIGPDDQGGIVLSGHTDVVPVDGQDWSSDPFKVKRGEGRLFGRGTADMKSFIAIALAQVPHLTRNALTEPVHFALSFDEEVGCLGVRHLLADLAERDVKPRYCVVGEPTSMGVIRGHKGKLSLRCHVHGLGGHSGLTHRAVNALEAACEAVAFLKSIAREFRDDGIFDEAFDPPYTTVHTGVIQGGTQLNIVPDYCRFDFECRHLPADDPHQVLSRLKHYIESTLLPEMRAVFGDARIEFETLAEFAGLDAAEDHPVVALAQQLSESTTAGKVSFGTEAGLFSEIGIQAVVCGPGDIRQAHKADEYIELDQIAACEQFMQRLLSRVGAHG